MASARKNAASAKSKRPPATTPEARENQLINLAVDLAEQQLLDGTASSQVITHYLKLASSRGKLENEKIGLENELLIAKAESIASSARIEELYTNAIDAMKSYSGQTVGEDEFE